MDFKLGAWETKLKINVWLIWCWASCFLIPVFFFEIAVPLLCAAFYSTLQMNEMCLKVESKNL